MNLILNNREEFLNVDEEFISVNKIREIKKFSFNHLVVKVNSKLIKKDQFDSPVIKEGDKVDIIHLISGG